jgi:hypothetical protein
MKLCAVVVPDPKCSIVPQRTGLRIPGPPTGTSFGSAGFPTIDNPSRARSPGI